MLLLQFYVHFDRRNSLPLFNLYSFSRGFEFPLLPLKLYFYSPLFDVTVRPSFFFFLSLFLYFHGYFLHQWFSILYFSMPYCQLHLKTLLLFSTVHFYIYINIYLILLYIFFHSFFSFFYILEFSY